MVLKSGQTEASSKQDVICGASACFDLLLRSGHTLDEVKGLLRP